MRRTLIVLALLLAPSLASAQTAPAELACTGPFARDASHQKLVAAFGAGNVAVEEIHVGEGQTVKGTVLFAKDPARRIEVLWWDEKGRKRPSTVRVSEGSTLTAAGLGIGATLQEVEKRNGKAFALAGFDWDYGGTVTDFKGGALAKLPGGCTLQLRFSPDDAAPEAARMKVAGDKSFSSASPAMRAVRPLVGEIAIGWPE